MRLRLIGVVLTTILFATACEKAFEQASGGLADAPAIPAPGAPGTSTTLAPSLPPPAPDAGSGPATTSTVPSTSTPSVPATTSVAPTPPDPAAGPGVMIVFVEEGGEGDVTSAPPTTTVVTPTTSVSPVDPGTDGWPGPGPVAGRTTIEGSGNWVVDYRDFGSPWYIHDVDVLASGGHAVGPPTAVGGGVMENSSVVVEGGDNIKIADGGIYRNLYLRMATSGGHLDAMQVQGNTGWRIEDVVVDIPSPTDSVTGAVIVENKVGGGGGYRDVIGTIDGLKIIGTGPWHHDIRLQNDPAASMSITITNVDWSQAHAESVLVLTGSPQSLTVYLDDSVPPSRIRGAANATIVRF